MTTMGGYQDGDSAYIKGGTDDTSIGNVSDQLKTTDVCNISGVYGALTVGTSAVQVKVGGSVLTNRKLVTVQPKDNSIYWGYDSSVTTSTGTQVFKDTTLFIPVGPSVDVYLIADVSNRNVRIGELS